MVFKIQLKDCKSVYSQSKQTDNHAIAEFLRPLDLPVLCKEANDKLTSPITKEEISAAISSLNSNKSPGIDGFPPER